MSKFTEAEIEALKASLMNTIMEIAAAAHHIEHDEPADAAQCLMTAQGTLDQVAEQVAAKEE